MGRHRPLVLIVSAAVFALALGIYLGVQFTQPPPRPDLGSIRPEPGTEGPGSGRAGSRPEAPAVPPAGVTVAGLHEPAPAPEPLRVERQPPPAPAGRPRISIVIDDLGRSLRDLDTLAALDVPITYAVLPFETRTPEVVAELRRRGEEILCHLPMEASTGADPGPGALRRDMSPGELRAATRRALEAVPGASGVNNHMGSGVMPRREAIAAVLEVVAERGLYFLDSRTSADTLGYSLARRLGVAAGERQVFLDTERDPAFIRAQFDRLLETAEARGGAVAIAHPYPETLEILAARIPEARAAGFDFVRASALLEG